MREYWGMPEATRQAFCGDWFRTGDVAVVANDVYRILGRMSVDIIKTGGYKISALEVEETLRTHPDICECSVIGIPDPVRGEAVVTCVVLNHGSVLTPEELQLWAKDRLAPYKIPTRLRILDQLPTNTMGKVQKSKMKDLFEA
jgi:malonyl-CoA/methylmalonyl-CoA synthetase